MNQWDALIHGTSGIGRVVRAHSEAAAREKRVTETRDVTDEFGRSPPQMEPGYTDVLYAVIDPWGKHISDFCSDYDHIVYLRNNSAGWEMFRIAEFRFRVIEIDPDPASVIDDPLQMDSICPNCGDSYRNHVPSLNCGVVPPQEDPER